MKPQFLFLLTLASLPALADDFSRMVKIGNCSGVLVSLGVLTAGHCPIYPNFYKKDEAESGTDMSKEKAFVFPTGDVNQSTELHLKKITYATMTNIDAALIEAEKIEGVKTFKIADRLPKPGEILRITSAFWKESQDCEVEKILEDDAMEEAAVEMKTDRFPFRNSILFKNPCYGRTGWSGSPAFDPETGMIYGIFSRVYGKPKALTFARFGAFSFFAPLGTEVRVVASNVVDLHDCLSKKGELDLNTPQCSLPKPKPQPSKLTAPKNSKWPTSRARR